MSGAARAYGRREAVIVGAARTPIGKFLGGLSALPATELGGAALKAAVDRSGVEPGEVEDVFMGQVLQAGVGQAPARQAALAAGLPEATSATTVNKVCASGLEAIHLGAARLQLGEARCVVAGGMESMSRAPHLLLDARTGIRLGAGRLEDAVVHDGLWCPIENWHMGNAAEWIAERRGVSRAEMDELALRSHQRAADATSSGAFREELVPVEVRGAKGSAVVVDQDEAPRADASLDRLASLKPAFSQDGLVTAGNAPGLTDGAAAVVLAEESWAEQRGLRPLARVTGYATAALAPKAVFEAPELAVRDLLRRTGRRIDDFDLIEVNEAFAAQILANGRELGWDWERVNVHGGAIALGHPIGATGARIVVTLLHALRQRGLRTGLAALCHGGGGAVAMSFEVI
jgi:acetyl-CoA C-acetyltransferase